MAVRKTSGTGAAGGVVYDRARARTPAPTGETPARGDSSGITPAARELSSALHVVEASDDVRSDKVRALREQIANGTYNPDPKEIARKLVERGF